MDDAIEAFGCDLTDLVGEPGEVLGVLHVQFDRGRYRLRQPLRDAVDQPEPVESGDDHLRALFLRDLRGVECDRASVMMPVTRMVLPSSSPPMSVSILQ